MRGEKRGGEMVRINTLGGKYSFLKGRSNILYLFNVFILYLSTKSVARIINRGGHF